MVGAEAGISRDIGGLRRRRPSLRRLSVGATCTFINRMCPPVLATQALRGERPAQTRGVHL
jgi:hypothetical protein